MICVGIDPGKKGAVVAVDTAGRAPLIVRAEGHYATRSLGFVPGRMRAALREVEDYLVGADVPHVFLLVLERQSFRPMEGRKSVFTTAFGFGLWEGLVEAVFGERHVTVHPSRWQEVTRDVPGSNPKRRALHAARAELGLELEDHDDGVADAACMALFARRVLEGRA